MTVGKRVLLVVLVCLFSASLAEALRSASNSQHMHPGKEALEALRQSASRERMYDIRTAAVADPTSDDIESFGQEQQEFIRQWFSGQQQFGLQPPDERTPPLERDGILPVELRHRFQPLPLALESQLPALSPHLRRGIVLRDVILLNENTSRIVDLMHGVLQSPQRSMEE